MSNAKSQVRSELKQRLAHVLPEERAAWSQQAAARLLATEEYQRARTIMLFVSLASEIDTAPVATDAWRTGRRVAVPRAHLEDRSMEALLINDFARDMRKTKIGVLEPVSAECLALGAIDLVLVPGLGFGRNGERIGRGAGFYDRFLARPDLSAVTCGYAFDIQVHDGIPMGPADTYLRMLITDREVRRFGRPG